MPNVFFHDRAKIIRGRLDMANVSWKSLIMALKRSSFAVFGRVINMRSM